MTLVALDYSQIELRILAHYAQDEILINAFAEGIADLNERIVRETARSGGQPPRQGLDRLLMDRAAAAGYRREALLAPPPPEESASVER